MGVLILLTTEDTREYNTEITEFFMLSLCVL